MIKSILAKMSVRTLSNQRDDLSIMHVKKYSVIRLPKFVPNSTEYCSGKRSSMLITNYNYNSRIFHETLKGK